MYDPKIGRWLSSDPIWPVDNINPYLYVDNAPTNANDPSGLQKKEQPVSTGKGIKEAGLKDNEFRIAGRVVQVNAYTLSSIRLPDKTNPESGFFALNIEGPEKIIAKAHWLQVIRKTQEIDPESKVKLSPYYLSLIRVAENQPLVPALHMFGLSYLDSDPYSPFYDETGITIRDKEELTIYDKPELAVDLGALSETFYADNYLFYEGKLYYHVHWELKRLAGRLENFQNVTGSPLTPGAIPPFFKTDLLTIAYSRSVQALAGGAMGALATYSAHNPIPKANR